MSAAAWQYAGHAASAGGGVARAVSDCPAGWAGGLAAHDGDEPAGVGIWAGASQVGLAVCVRKIRNSRSYRINCFSSIVSPTGQARRHRAVEQPVHGRAAHALGPAGRPDGGTEPCGGKRRPAPLGRGGGGGAHTARALAAPRVPVCSSSTVVYVHIPEKGVLRLSKEQGLGVVFWAK